MRRFRVSCFLADVTQQIHSFRANGVIAAQRLFAAASDSMARRKSDGSLWIMTPNDRCIAWSGTSPASVGAKA